MTGRDPAGVFRENAEKLAGEREKLTAGERLIGRDAANLFSPDLSGAKGDPAQTAELLFSAGDAAREFCHASASRLSFAAALIEKYGITEADLFPVLPAGEKTRLLYARVGAADRAFRLFSTILSDPRVGYAESNSDAAEGVESGDADLLILPYADAAGNPVLSSRALADTYGLYLAALAKVKAGDGLTYGLYGRAVLPDTAGRTTLHLSLPAPDPDTAADIFAIARDAELVPSGVALPEDGRATAAFSGKRDDCLAAAVAAVAFFPGCELRGWRPEKPLSER
ncbi:MAG: hypothetical protein IKX66_05705 [Clostridia bacterium]|nr:hypothetical protein [Clostridia bacterium]